MGKIRWRKLALPIAIAAVLAIGLPGLIIWILDTPVVWCYNEDTPDQVEYGAENCLPKGAIAAEKL